MDLARMALEQAWQLTALVIVAWLTVRIVAHNRPHLAYMLWLVVLLKAVTPPLWSSPTSVFSWVQASKSHDLQYVRASPETIHDLHPPIVSRQIPAPYERAPVPTLEPRTERTAARLTANSSAPDSSVMSARHVLGGLVVIWCGGVLAALLITTVRWSKCIYLLRVSPAIDRPDLDDLVAKLSRELRIRGRVRLLVTSCRIGPAVVGLFRPLIVLPEMVVQGKRADDLKAIIAHELLHVRRGDLWLGLLQVCARAVWWFHPLVWWASRMSTREAERCCDEEVIGELRCDPKRYARSLLEVLELKQTLRTIPAFPGMRPVEVTSQRLERIMRLGQGCHKRTPRWCWAVMLLLTLGVLPGATLVIATDPPRTTSANVEDELLVEAASAGGPDIGAPTIHIAVEILRVPRSIVDDAITDWTLASMELADADDGNEENGGAGKQPDLPLPDADSLSKAVSGRAIEARFPALYKIIGDQEAAAIRHRILQDRRAIKLVAPRVNVFSGQSASIVDATQRPFVVGFQEGGEPQIRCVTEGTTLRVRPSLFDENRIGLAYDLKLNRVTDVSTSTFRIEGRIEPVTIQVPEVETTSVECSLTFASGKTLLIGGLTTKDEKDKMQAVLVMLKATRQPAANRTGRAMLGSGVKSDVGVTGQIAIDDANFEVDPQRSVEQRLSQPINAQFTNLPLHEALAVISRQIDLPIKIDLEGVAAEGVTPEQPVSLSIGETSADNALRLLLETHDLRYSLEDNKVVVSGISSAPMITAVYSIADLLMNDLAWLDQPEAAALPHRSAESRSAATLVAAIVDRVQPESWDKMGGRGAIESFLTNQSLVVSQTEPVHRKVDTFLAETRKQLGIISEMPQSPSFHLLRSKKLCQNVNMHMKVYAVADLVIPAPPWLPGPQVLPRVGTIPQGAFLAHFDSLVDRITSTVVPESWASAGGIGQIEVFPTNLSIVINQSAEVHEQVTDLINQLRRMQDVQISIETQLLRVPKSFLPTDKLPGFVVRDVTELDARGVENVGGPTRLSATEAAALLQAIDQAAEDADCRNVALPKITLFNGQPAQLSAQENGLFKLALEYQAVICSDRRSIFLKVATDAKLSLDEQMLASGSSLLMRIDDPPVRAWKSEATKNSPTPKEHVHLLLVTPTVIVVGE